MSFSKWVPIKHVQLFLPLKKYENVLPSYNASLKFGDTKSLKTIAFISSDIFLSFLTELDDLGLVLWMNVDLAFTSGQIFT